MRVRLLVALLSLPLALQIVAGRSPDTAGYHLQASAAPDAGLVVEVVGPGSAPADAGVRPGDRLLAWERVDPAAPSRIVTRGEFRTPFDTRGFELEQLPRGNTRLIVDRNSSRLVLPLVPGAWDLITRPPLSGNALVAYDAGMAAAGAGDAAKALDILQPIIDTWRTQRRFDHAAWLLSRAGAAIIQTAQEKMNQEKGSRLEEAERVFSAALDEARKTADAALEAYVWEAQGQAAHTRWASLGGTYEAYWSSDPVLTIAVGGYKGALEIRKTIAPQTLTLAASQFVCADFCPQPLSKGTDPLAPRQFACEASITRASLAPGSFDQGMSLWSVGRLLERDAPYVAKVNYWTRCPPGAVPQPSGAAATVLKEQARVTLERVAPHHPTTAQVLHQLGKDVEASNPEWNHEAAIPLYRRALAILDGIGIGPDTLVTDPEGRRRFAPLKTFLQEVGYSLLEVGELDDAESVITRYRRTWPVAVWAIDTLSEIASRRGDVARAEDLHYQLLAMAADRSGPPETQIPVARVLRHLGQDSFLRGDLERADALLQHALGLEEETVRSHLEATEAKWKDRPKDSTWELNYKRDANPNRWRCTSTIEVNILSRLSDIKLARGDLQAASRFAEEAISIAAFCATLPRPLGGLSLGLPPPGELMMRRGQIAAKRGDLAAAETTYSNVIEQLRAPASFAASAGLQALGDVRRAASKPDLARVALEEGLALRAKQAPGSRWHAETLHSLGLVQRDLGQPAEAERSLRGAIDTLDRQRARLGGTGLARLGFAERFTAYYRDYLEFLLEHNRPAEAFEVLERSHARTMIEMLAERRVDLAADVPAPLGRERDKLAAEYDRVQDRILGFDPIKNKTEIEAGLQRLYQLQGQLDAVAARIQKASPRAAALEYPTPLTLAGARAALDAGTVLLSYAVGQSRTFLFVVSPTGLSVFTIAAGEKDLRQRVDAFRRLLEWQAGGSDDPAIRLAGSRELYDLLVRPAESLIAPARRLALSPDGPLGLLPFAALVRGGTASRPGYLVEWKPLHTTLSATVYASLKARRPASPRTPVTLVAFGDPQYPAVPASRAPARRDAGADAVTQALEVVPPPSGLDPNVQFLVRGGLNLVPLPASRREVEAIGRLFAPSATVHVGANATEERAKGVGTGTRVLHFAVHGVLTPRFPLNSGLALTIPEKRREGADNGLLQAWEVFERMRLDADLVTLSACESALGAEIGSEGLFGLTRAFEYAGARSVLASLWKVGDEATLELMTRFYANLKAGQPKDEALRNAQLTLIRASDNGLPTRLALPVHWAAFQLDGDWK